MSLETQFIRKAGATQPGTDTLPSDITDVVLKRIIILCLISAGMATFGVVMTLGGFLSMTVVLQDGYSAVEFLNDSLMIVVSWRSAFMRPSTTPWASASYSSPINSLLLPISRSIRPGWCSSPRSCRFGRGQRMQ